MKPLKILGMLIALALLCLVQALAADTQAPAASEIIVNNYLTGRPDEVTVKSGLISGDIVRVYSSLTNPVPVGVAVASGPSVTVYVNQLGTVDGTAYVTVTSGTDTESERTDVAYVGELRTDAPADITVENNVAGRLDKITVREVLPGDVVRAYSNAVGNVVLGTTVVGPGSDSATLYVNQLGIMNGTVYMTVQSAGLLESLRTGVSYTTEMTPALPAAAFEITIMFFRADTDADGQLDGTEDIVLVKGLAENDRIRLYKSPAGTETWADETAGADGDLEIKIGQLPAKGGVFYATITKPGKAESRPVTVTFKAEDMTLKPLATNVKVANNYDTNTDQIAVWHVPNGYTVKAYKTDKDPLFFASGTALSDDATVTLELTSTELLKTGGRIYITLTSPDANESDRTPVTYIAEPVTQKPRALDVTVANGFGAANDSMTVDSLADGYTVRIYDRLTGGTLLVSGVATGDSLEFTAMTGLLPIGGKLYVSVQSTVAHESERTLITYGREDFSTPPALTSVTVTNNYKIDDTVKVDNIKETDKVSVYAVPTGGTPLVPPASPAPLGTSVTVSLPDKLLLAAGGRIFVSVTSENKNESARTSVSYKPEIKAAALTAGVITVDNYIGTDNDALTVTSGLSDTDVVTIYASATGTQSIGSGSPGAGGTFVRIPVTTLSSAGGRLFVTVTKATEGESSRTPVIYGSERAATLPVGETGVSVVNNYNAPDIVTVRNVQQNDKITIYKTGSGTETWIGPVTVGSDGDLTISIPQLGVTAGRIYVTIITANKTESTRAIVPYAPEITTDALPPSAITVQNNYQLDDTITITGVTSGHTVSVYTTMTGVPPIASMVTSVSTVKFTIENGVLAATGGKVYVTVKDPDKQESTRTPASYTPETSIAPLASTILVVNYPGAYQDTVTIVGLSPGDTVTVYTLATGGEILAQETVPGKGTTVTLTARLYDTGGTVFVSVTGAGKAESKRTPIRYDAD